MSILLGDLWRWSMNRVTDDEDDLARFWRQIVRWTVTDVPDRLSVQVEQTSSAGASACELRIRCHDRDFVPLENCNVKIRVQTPDGRQVDVQPEPSLKEVGRFDAAYVARESGAHRAVVTLSGIEGEADLTTEVGWTSEPAAEEFQRIDIDRQRMSDLAAATGGEVIAAVDLESFVTGLPSRKAPVTETWFSPLWHRSWVFLLVLAGLAGEWGLRRLRGLP